jgi:hypothetical protein
MGLHRSAYGFARRRKTLKGLPPYRFTLGPPHQMQELNT